MDVLEDEYRSGPRLQLASEGCDDLVGNRAVLDERLQLAAGIVGNCEQRPEWTRREERVAPAPEDPSPTRLRVAEGADESGLPHARLAAHEHEPALRALVDAAQRFPKQGEVARALEQRARGRCGAQVATACDLTLSTYPRTSAAGSV